MASESNVRFTHVFKIESVQTEKRIVWGWVYVSHKNGQRVVDHSKEFIIDDDVEKMAHGFVSDFGEGNVMHEGADVMQVVDSIFFSEDIQEVLEIDLKKIGWFAGFKVLDDAAWEDVKTGKLRMFSIEGDALRRVVEV